MGQPLTLLRVGTAGAGRISGQCLETLARTPELRLTAVTDLDPARAERAAAGARPANWPRTSWR